MERGEGTAPERGADRPALREALRDPAAAFATPTAVLDAPGLDDTERLRVLESWEYDARELAVASEEGMAGGEPTGLSEVLAALAALRRRMGLSEDDAAPPTKH